MQIYGIDLAKEKFDVSFCDLTSKKVSNQPSHKVVKNNFKSIGRFLETLPSDAVLVAEHTGVYGDTLLKCCMDSNVKKCLQVIDYFAAKEDAAIFECWLINDHLCTLYLDTLHDALNGRLAEVVGIGFHRQAIDTDDA